jgi:hypothetical protein
MVIKIIAKKVKVELGLKEIKNGFAYAFKARKDVYKCGPYVVSITKTNGLKYYYIWNSWLRSEFSKLVVKEKYQEAEALLKTITDNRQLLHMAHELLDKIPRSKYEYVRADRISEFLALVSTAGFIELDNVRPGWKSRTVEYAFIREDLRGTGLGTMLYDAALVAGGEILCGGELQSAAARRVWLSILKNPSYTCWVENDEGERGLIEALSDQELFDLDKNERKDENKLVNSPFKVWFLDRGDQDPTNVRIYAIAKNPKNGLVRKKRKAA